jgi:hypothetical protein
MTKLFTVFICSLVCILHAQKHIVKLEVNQKKLTLGNELIITVRSNVEGEISIDFPSEFVRGYDVMSGLEQEVDYNTGIVNTISYYSQNGSFKKTGTFVVGPAYIKRGKHIYKSNTVQVTVQKEPIDNSNGTITSRQLKQLAFGVIEVNKTSLYEGEPLLVQAKVYSRFAPTSIEDYQSYKLEQSLDKHTLDNSQNLTAKRETIKGVGMFVINHDRNLVFPSGGGALQINPFKLILRQNNDGVAVVSTGTNITVKPLPSHAPPSFIGFVGALTAQCQYEGSCDKKGDVLKLEVVLTGKGNLHNIDAPKIKLSKGLIQFGKPELTEEFSFGPHGADGKVIFKYSIQSTDNNVKSIDKIRVTYFNPEKEEYITLSMDGYQSNATKSVATINNKGTTTIIKKDPNQKKNTSGEKSSNTISWVVLCISSVLFLASFGVFYSRKKSLSVEQDKPIKESSPLKSHAINRHSFDEQFDQALSEQDLTRIERIVFSTLAQAFNKPVDVINKEELLDELRLRNESEFIQIAAWSNAIQQAKYGLNLNDSDEQHLLNESKSVFALIKQNYSIS